MEHYGTPEIKCVWSREAEIIRWHALWSHHEKFVPKTSDVFTPDEIRKIRKSAEASEHEIVKELFQSVADGRRSLNCHLGLTSSDIVDNSRMIACIESAKIIQESFGSLLTTIIKMVKTNQNKKTVAYTHLIPAKVVSWSSVLHTWSWILGRMIEDAPIFKIRGFRGSVGDTHQDNKKMYDILHESNIESGYPLEEAILLQNMSPLSVLSVVHFVENATIILNKINQDCRFYVIFGRMERREKDPTASSTLVHKHSNPATFERHVALCRNIISKTQIIKQTLLDQFMQRTLDDSAIYRTELPQIWGFLHYISRETREEIQKYELNDENHKIDPANESAIMEETLNSNGQKSRMRLDLQARKIL